MLARLAVPAALAALAAAAPAPAGAALASLEYEEPIPGVGGEPAYALVVEGGPGESNQISVSGDAAAYSVRDDGAPLTAGPGCEAVGPQAVRCSTPVTRSQRSVLADGGDLDDRIVIGSLPRADVPPGVDTVEVRGGAGDDALSGGIAHELLLGGAGNDTIAAAGGFDRLEGGLGDDRLDGGSEQDTVSYEARREPVAVDLAAGEGGAEGERDELAAIEDIIGGRAGDRLAGDAGPNELMGGEGDARDVLDGRGGDDLLRGYRLRGGAGDDSLDGKAVSCGRGTDMVYRGVFKTRGPYRADCETAQAVFVVITTRPTRRSRGHADFGVRCGGSTCSGRLSLSDREGRLGSARFKLEQGEHPRALHRVRISLARRGSRRVVTLTVRGVSGFQHDYLRVPWS